MFQIGDRVVLVVRAPDANEFLRSGHMGVVRCFEEAGAQRVGVEWDDFQHGHSLRRRSHNRNAGWYVFDDEIVLVDEGDDSVDLDGLL